MICPFEIRYGSKEMRSIFSDESRAEELISVEKSLLMALIDLGLLEEDAFPEVKALSLDYIGGIDKLKILEKEIGHEVLALVNALSSSLGEYGSFVHLGLSSSDVIDTANSLEIRKALFLLEKKIVRAIKILLRRAAEYSDVILLSRTHRSPALPVKFSFILTYYAFRLAHILNLLEKYRRWWCYGKLSGPTGCYPMLGKFQVQLEKVALRKLHLFPSDISSQWLPREYLAKLIFFLSLLCSVLAKICKDFWERSRPEIGEISFPKVPSSSSMPHKSNSLKLERVIGMSRICRSLTNISLENIEEEGEGDVTKSSAERIIISHAFLAADQALEDTIWALENFKVNRKRAERNLKKYGEVSSFLANLLTSLCLKGMNRKEAYEIVTSIGISSKSLEEIIEAVKKDPIISKFMSDEEIEKCRSIYAAVSASDLVEERARRKIKTILSSLAI